MITLHRLTARLAAVASLATLLAAACTDSNGPSGPALLAHGDRNDNSSGGASSGFSVLANAAVTCTGGSVVGDVGTFLTAPPGAITLTEGCLVSGAQDIGGPAAVAAYNAFLDQYAALAPQLGEIGRAHV